MRFSLSCIQQSTLNYNLDRLKHDCLWNQDRTSAKKRMQGGGRESAWFSHDFKQENQSHMLCCRWQFIAPHSHDYCLAIIINL